MASKAVRSWMTSRVVYRVALLVLVLVFLNVINTVPRAESVSNEPEEVEETEDFEEEQLAETIENEQVETEGVEELPPMDELPIVGSSVDAVSRALEWFANHQNTDGSWDFDHQGGECQGQCGNPGVLAGNAKLGATAMALLPFLGNGNTHLAGKYKENVQAGLYYLVSNMKVEGERGSLMDAGNMYSHGLATFALCEAYGMTQARGLEEPAQLAINHIVYAQDPIGGGWRYQPRTDGDISVLGWQLLALNSAHMTYLDVPAETIRGAERFLDSVQSDDDESRFGYTGPGACPSTTSIGLLCRMFLGWKHYDPRLQNGVEFLSGEGPSAGDMYYNYYATQVMRNYGGDEWEQWREVMRKQLVSSQETEGHARGSWYQGGDHGSGQGGRHYVTALSTMILQVRQGRFALWRPESAEEDFPL